MEESKMKNNKVCEKIFMAIGILGSMPLFVLLCGIVCYALGAADELAGRQRWLTAGIVTDAAIFITPLTMIAYWFLITFIYEHFIEEPSE